LKNALNRFPVSDRLAGTSIIQRLRLSLNRGCSQLFPVRLTVFFMISWLSMWLRSVEIVPKSNQIRANGKKNREMSEKWPLEINGLRRP